MSTRMRSDRKGWRRVHTVAAVVACALFAASLATNATQRAEFDRKFGGFVEGNHEMIRVLSKKPPSRHREEAIRAAQANLEWADQYRRTGVDPEIIEEMKFRRQLANAERERERETYRSLR